MSFVHEFLFLCTSSLINVLCFQFAILGEPGVIYGEAKQQPRTRPVIPDEGTTTHHGAPLEGQLLDRNFLSICALLDISSLYSCCIDASCNVQGFRVCTLPPRRSKEGASSIPRSWLSLECDLEKQCIIWGHLLLVPW